MINDLIKIFLVTIWIYITAILVMFLKFKDVNISVIYSAIISTIDYYPILFILTVFWYFYGKMNGGKK